MAKSLSLVWKLVCNLFSFSLSSIKLLPAAFAYGTTGNFHYWEGGGYSTLPSIIEKANQLIKLKENLGEAYFYRGYANYFLEQSFFGEDAIRDVDLAQDGSNRVRSALDNEITVCYLKCGNFISKSKF